VVVLGMLPVIGNALRHDAVRHRCAFDGQVTLPAMVVTMDVSGRSITCCDVRCARRWLVAHSFVATRIEVRDERGGGAIDSSAAFFVRSSVITNRVNGNRWHVFRDRAAAEQHARESRGRLMQGEDHPFADPGGVN